MSRSAVRAFEPPPLPPPGLRLDGVTLRALSEADRALGFLYGQIAARESVGDLIALACRREAVASCRLDGSRITLRDLLWWELDGNKADRLAVPGGEARICANYAEALGSMLPESAKGQDEAVSQSGIRSLHKALFARLRGRDDRPGEFRRTIIWLGPAGSTAATAHFVPPLPQRIPEHVDRLQAFWRRDAPLPPLARIALVSLQLESLHPFVDGSGRVSRLCLLRMLQSAHGAWPQLLTPSVAMAAHIGEHFRNQQRARIQGEWEAWIRYFARRLEDAAVAAARRLERMDAELQEQEDQIGQHMAGLRQTAGALLGELARKPLVTVSDVARICDRTFANANLLVGRLEELGLLQEITGRRRNRRFLYSLYREEGL